MPKKKRTRQQKIQADVKREPTPRSHVNVKSAVTREVKEQRAEAVSSGTFSLPEQFIKQAATATHVPPKTVTIATAEYSYLRGDLLKTTFLTLGIVVIQLVIHFFVMN